MPKVSPLQDNFNGGEFSPLLYGRVTADRYKTALATCLNYIPTIQGGLTRRSGSYFASEVKDSSKYTRLIPFEFSTTQAYMLEFGNQYIRFYKDNGLITIADKTITAATQADPVVVTSNSHGFSNGDRIVIQGVLGMTQLNNREFRVANVATNTFELQDSQTGTNVDGTAFDTYTSGGTAAKIYEIASPYLEADLLTLKFTQSADVLYIVHTGYAPRKLTRTAHTSWTLTTISFTDGPYLATNSTSTTLTPSAATGTGVTLTASSVTGINNNTGFQSTDVGRTIRILEGSTWGYVTITGYTSTTVVTVTVNSTLTNTNAKTSWRLGAWSTTYGFPSCVCFHEDRLVFAGAPAAPQTIYGSRTSEYENFTPTATDGSVTSTHAFSFTFNANDVNVARWITSDEKGLLCGTVGGEWTVRPSTQSEAISPTNVNAKRSTSLGSADVQPIQAGKATIFVQRAGRKLREMYYFYDVEGFRSNDLSQLSEHITGEGLLQLAYQKTPQSLVWAVRTDGVLLSMVYERDIESFTAGWARHIIGGVSDAAGSNAVVESVAVIPSADGTRDEVWIIVQRRINGSTRRYVEYLTKIFDDNDEQKDAFFVDSGLSLDNPVDISGATAANPVVITASNHGFSNGDEVLITGVEGMTELNGNHYTVANKTTHTFQLSGINGTSYTAYVSGGEVRKLVSTLTGLHHLEGETLDILGDGAVIPSAEVSNGKLSLSIPSAVVHTGLSYRSDAQTLRLEAGAADGTALGKTRRIHRVGFLLHRTLGFKLGMDFDNLFEHTFRTSADPGGRATELYSGIISQNVEAFYDFENQVCWRQEQPLPGMILSYMPQMVTQDRS